MDEHLGCDKISVTGNNSGNSEKRLTRTDEIEQKIITMYEKGILQVLISRITDKILPEVNEWHGFGTD